MAVKWMTFRKYRGFIWGLELDQLTNYVKATNTALDVGAAEFSLKIQEMVDENPDDADGIYTASGREAMELLQVFPALNNAATFIAIYSFLEHQLVDLCKTLQKRCRFGISVNDLRGSGIDQSKKYLERVFGYRFPSDTPEWQEIKKLQRLRNILVHRRGVLEPDGDADVREYLAQKTTVIINGGEIALSGAFCFDAIETVRGFLVHIVAMLPAQIRLRTNKPS